MIRLFVTGHFAQGEAFELLPPQAHYLSSVMRKGEGEKVLVFNGTDGEWEADISGLSKRKGELVLCRQVQPQTEDVDVMLCFSLVKQTPLQFIVQKATELGVSILQPVIAQRSVVRHFKSVRYQQMAIEAAEQCGRLSVPEVREPVVLDQLLQGWQDRRLLLCDESGGGRPILEWLLAADKGPIAVLVGPEGGFSPQEFAGLRQKDFVVPITLGPRTLRADTASLAVLSLVQACVGDWDLMPSFKGDEIND